MSETNKTINTVDMEKVSAILLDVAGTTTAISFVKDTLYPYIIKNAEEFLKNSWEDEDVKKAVAQFEEKELDASKAAEAVKNLTEKDDSNVGLKTIQGLLLKKGYEGGELKGQLFADVQKFLESWSSTKKFAVFSSGSVESQQLLFKNSSEGDLTTHIKKFFDLSMGSKTDTETYTKIAKELEVAPVEVLFLTDDVKEAEAAKSAELNVVIVEREGNAPISEEIQGKFTVVKSFADISVEKMKRKIVEDSTEEPPKKLAKVEINAVTEIKNENEKKSEETKQTDEKKDTKNCDEAMDVDEEPIVTEKVEEEKVSAQDEKKPKPEESVQEENTVKPKPETTEEIPESMEVDAKVESKTDDLEKDQTEKEAKQESEEQTNKAEIEMGTQTKCAVTNECETQTTISIAAVDELPIKEVQDKLMASQTGGTKEGEIVEKAEKNDDKKNVEVVEKKCDKEEKETEKETNTNGDVKGDKIETKNEVQEESKKDKAENEDKTVKSDEGSEKIEELKEGVKEVKEEVKEMGEKVKEVKEDVKEVKEDVKEVKEDIKDVKEDVKVVKEDSKESKDVKEDKVIKEKKDEVKENGKVCEKSEGESESKKLDGKSKDKEITDEKKVGLESNGAQENKDSASHENGIADATVEKENKSQLANGKDSVVPNGEASQATNGTSEKKEEEIKVKKIGDNVESAPVSVEA